MAYSRSRPCSAHTRRHSWRSHIPAIFVRKRVLPSRPCSFEKPASRAALERTGWRSSMPRRDHVPELMKSGLPRDGAAATAEAVSWLPQVQTFTPRRPVCSAISGKISPRTRQGSVIGESKIVGIPNSEATSTSHSGEPAKRSPDVLAIVRSVARTPQRRRLMSSGIKRISFACET